MSKIVITDYLKDDDGSKKHMRDAISNANNHDKGYLDIPFIEHSPDSTLLYNHILSGQISPEFIKQLSTDDLMYIAGHLEPDEKLDPEPKARVRANAIRAQHEIQRRERAKDLCITAAVAFVAAFVGAAATFLWH